LGGCAIVEQTAAREALQHSQSKYRTANAATGNAERGTPFWQLADPDVNRKKAPEA